MSADTCCTCATLLSALPPLYSEKLEKEIPQHPRILLCCGRAICTRCIDENPRFATYCPFCQVSTAPGALPQQGLKDPPAYTPPEGSRGPGREKIKDDDEGLPDYESSVRGTGHIGIEEKVTGVQEGPAQDVLHFLDPQRDTLHSLSLRYGVPLDALRRKNGVYSDHLLSARRTILIPGEYYKGGVSLSPRPVEGEEEEIRRAKIRKWMVACKVAEYDVALLYLKQADYDLEAAIDAYKADEKWEKEHPLDASGTGKGKARAPAPKKRFGFGGLAGQI